METEKAKDARLRRTAKRLGLNLAKGGKFYQIIDGRTHRPYYASMPWLDADAVEDFLKTYQETHGGKVGK